MSFQPKPDASYFVPLGGIGQIGQNCYLYIDQGRFLLVDCGINFPDHSLPGVDFILPDIDYVVKNRDKLVGLVITHGHEDHIGAIPYLWPELRCPIYATPFTAALLQRKMAEVGLAHEAKIRVVKGGDKLGLDPFDIEFISITHSIPDNCSLKIEMSHGTVLHTGDWKLDDTPLVGKRTDWKRFEKLKNENILALICDSTNIDTPGHSVSEAVVRENFLRVFAEQKEAVALTLFSSNIARVDSAFWAAIELGRDVCLVGRSLETYVQTAMELGYLNHIPKFIPQEDASSLPRDRILYLCTGCQGEPQAALPRIAAGQHKHIRLLPGDTVIYSSNRIPGNELEIIAVQNALASQGIHIITPRLEPIHASGHPSQDEVKKMHKAVGAKYVIPMHGEDQHLEEHAFLARQWKISEPFVCRNGTVVELKSDKIKRAGQVELASLGVEEFQLVRLDGDRMSQRRKMGYSGVVVASILQRRDLTFQMPVTFSILGLADSEHQREEMEKELRNEVKNVLARMPKKYLEDEEAICEEIRLALRRSLKTLTGKKPVLDIQLIQVPV